MSKASKQAKSGKKSPAKKRSSGKPRPRGRALIKQQAGDEEREHFIETLRANKQLAAGPGPLPPGATHAVESDSDGHAQVVRKRYSAF
jgi:hypothetical protein